VSDDIAAYQAAFRESLRALTASAGLPPLKPWQERLMTATPGSAWQRLDGVHAHRAGHPVHLAEAGRAISSLDAMSCRVILDEAAAGRVPHEDVSSLAGHVRRPRDEWTISKPAASGRDGSSRRRPAG
jgi:hypothetical protein